MKRVVITGVGWSQPLENMGRSKAAFNAKQNAVQAKLNGLNVILS